MRKVGRFLRSGVGLGLRSTYEWRELFREIMWIIGSAGPAYRILPGILVVTSGNVRTVWLLICIAKLSLLSLQFPAVWFSLSRISSLVLRGTIVNTRVGPNMLSKNSVLCTR
ncbi:unnamed protein product [Laminaria digitata]